MHKTELSISEQTWHCPVTPVSIICQYNTSQEAWHCLTQWTLLVHLLHHIKPINQQTWCCVASFEMMAAITESNATIAKINNVCNMSQQKHAQQMWAIPEMSQLPQKSKTAWLLPPTRKKTGWAEVWCTSLQLCSKQVKVTPKLKRKWRNFYMFFYKLNGGVELVDLVHLMIIVK